MPICFGLGHKVNIFILQCSGDEGATDEGGSIFLNNARRGVMYQKVINSMLKMWAYLILNTAAITMDCCSHHQLRGVTAKMSVSQQARTLLNVKE